MYWQGSATTTYVPNTVLPLGPLSAPSYPDNRHRWSTEPLQLAT